VKHDVSQEPARATRHWPGWPFAFCGSIADIMGMATQNLHGRTTLGASQAARGRRRRRSRELYLGAGVAILLAVITVAIEWLTKQAFVSGFAIVMLLVAAATFFITGRVAESE
jgi:hypothetical protein